LQQNLKAEVLDIEGKKIKEIELPEVFNEEYHPDIIKRAVLSIQTARLQPKGTKYMSGRDYSALYVGLRSMPTHERTINVERARLPRLKNRRGLLYGKVATVPQAVGGPKVHAPKKEKKLKEKINKKEKRKALRSAIAATINKKLVEQRHVLPKELKLPIIIENKFEELKKTKEVIKTLKALKVYEDTLNAKKKKKIRAGKGKKRGRKYKKKKSILIVTGENKPIYKAARNIEGIEVVSAKQLNAEHLAPGTKAGRLTIWTENAINYLRMIK
jgi:large subunit ribosomal protein L4e